MEVLVSNTGHFVVARDSIKVWLPFERITTLQSRYRDLVRVSNGSNDILRTFLKILGLALVLHPRRDNRVLFIQIDYYYIYIYIFKYV